MQGYSYQMEYLLFLVEIKLVDSTLIKIKIMNFSYFKNESLFIESECIFKNCLIPRHINKTIHLFPQRLHLRAENCLADTSSDCGSHGSRFESRHDTKYPLARH